ncbi:hypothetical protein JNM05_08960 [bacterium]|nr:hypothetical protein [bacterium]
MIPCEHEPETRQAMADGHWSDALRQHSTECESCRLTIGLYPALKNLSMKANIKAAPLYYKWILVQAEMQKEKARHKTLQRISSIAVSGTVAVCILLVSALFSSPGFALSSLLGHLAHPDVSLVWIGAALWLVSEFQLRFLFKLK